MGLSTRSAPERPVTPKRRTRRILTVNGGDGNIVETTAAGDQVAVAQIDPAGAGGDLFGLTLAEGNRGVLFVDDGDNTLKLFGQS